MIDKPLINRVANSGIITIDLEEYFPKHKVVDFDLKGWLFKEMILKEKDFRAALKEHDWSVYEGKVVTMFCSVDAIIPTWAYMLVSSYCHGIAADIFQGDKEAYLTYYYKNFLTSQDYTVYQDKRVVIKGCSNLPVPTMAYMEVTEKLKVYAQSIMYGEPCSTVPIFKRPRKV
jgi:hypothetical protein